MLFTILESEVTSVYAAAPVWPVLSPALAGVCGCYTDRDAVRDKGYGRLHHVS